MIDIDIKNLTSGDGELTVELNACGKSIKEQTISIDSSLDNNQTQGMS